MKATVVSVDDDPRVLESITSLMESAGYAALSFASAEAFLNSEALMAAGCVISDVRMPGLDGLELHRRIRVARPELPVIFISAHCDDAVINLAMQSGATAFFFKPFDPTVLLATIRSALPEQ